MKKARLFVALLIICQVAFADNQQYTVIPYDYDAVVQASQNVIKKLITANNRLRSPVSLNQLVENVGAYFEKTKHTPYAETGAEGEGDWCNNALTRRHCAHIQQDPVYRTDKLDCVTLVNIVMGLIGSHNLAEFNKNIVQIAYGANRLVNDYPNNELSYRNRNHFVSGSFNPINQKNHRIKDVTRQGIFAKLAKSTHATITRANWFAQQSTPARVKHYVRVLKASDGPAMKDKLSRVERFNQFPSQHVTINYIPKEALVKKITLPSQRRIYVADENRINQIPTPAIVEVVRNVKKWTISAKTISSIIGSGINVSHIALIYRHKFLFGQTIYQKTDCDYNVKKQKVCTVSPVSCQKKAGCRQVMLLAATRAYPNGYLWSYNPRTGRYACTPKADMPPNATPLTTCNRVMAMPLGDYLTYYAYKRYNFMESPSIVGLNVEKLMATE